MLYRALDARAMLGEKGYDVGVVNVHSPGELDKDSVRRAVLESHVIVTYEDHHIDLGLGSRMGTYLQETGMIATFGRLGWQRNPGSDRTEELYRQGGLCAHFLADFVQQKIVDARRRYSTNMFPKWERPPGVSSRPHGFDK
jgi:transketolase